MHSAIGGQRRLPAAHQVQKCLQFIGLGIVDVVAGKNRKVVGLAARRGQRVGAQYVNMRGQGKVGQRFIGPVHVQERLPQGLVR